MLRLPSLLLLVLLALLPPGTALAQASSGGGSARVPGYASLEERRRALNASAELSFADFRGNQEMMLLSTSGNVRWAAATHEMVLRLSTRRGTSEGERVVASDRVEANVEVGAFHVTVPYLRSTWERDPVRRLDVRTTAGLGAKFRPTEQSSKTRFSLAGALNHEYAQRTGGEGVHRARWSFQMEASHALSDQVSVTHYSALEPIWDWTSYRGSANTALDASITKKVGLVVTQEFLRDSHPGDGVKQNDQILRVGLRIRR